MPRQIRVFFNNHWAIVSIVIIAALLRFVVINQMPPSLNWDEVSHGYNAYSILKTAKDEWGINFPIIFRAYGDYKLPVYIYLTAISEFLFGLNTFAVRFLSLLSGIVTVLFTYLLTKELFSKNRNRNSGRNIYYLNGEGIALLSSLLVAVEPWSLFLSRAAFEANLALTFFVTGVYFFLKASSRNTYYFLLSTLFLGLTVWTYNSYRIFTPLFLVVSVFIFRKKCKNFNGAPTSLRSWFSAKAHKKTICYFLLPIAFFFIPMFFQLFSASGQARYGKVSIIDLGAIGKIIESRKSSDLNPGLARLIYNRPVYFTTQFSKNYLSHFTPYFLFINGGSHYQFSLPNHGLLYLINLPLFYLGFVLILKRALKSFYAQSRGGSWLKHFLIVAWLFLAPISSSLTREAPHVLRSVTFLPVPMILTSVSAFWLLNKLRYKAKVITTMIYIIVVTISLANYLSKYLGDYRKNYSWSWQYGYEEVVNYAKENYDKYDKIIITKKYGEPHEFFLFYWNWDPEKYRSDSNLIRFNQSNWWWVDAFDKFYFVNDWQVKERERSKEFILESKKIVDCHSARCLLVSSPNNFPEGWVRLKLISFLDGKRAFEIYEN